MSMNLSLYSKDIKLPPLYKDQDSSKLITLMVQTFYILIGAIIGVIIGMIAFLLTDRQVISILIGISCQIIVYFIGLFTPIRLSISILQVLEQMLSNVTKPIDRSEGLFNR